MCRVLTPAIRDGRDGRFYLRAPLPPPIPAALSLRPAAQALFWRRGPALPSQGCEPSWSSRGPLPLGSGVRGGTQGSPEFRRPPSLHCLSAASFPFVAHVCHLSQPHRMFLNFPPGGLRITKYSPEQLRCFLLVPPTAVALTSQTSKTMWELCSLMCFFQWRTWKRD